METLDFGFDAEVLTGLLLAIIRVGAFVVASPLLPPSIPRIGKFVIMIALGFFLAEPVGTLEVSELIAAAVVNTALGIALGFLTGIVVHLFAIAGNLVDMSSGLSVAALYDPSVGGQAAVFGRLFNFAALAAFYGIGGLGLVVRGLSETVRVIPLDGSLSPDDGLVDLALELISTMMVAAVELALPVLAALFLVEVVLGLAARFAPQANVFLLGLPAKLLVTMSVLSATVLLFPETLEGFSHITSDAFADAMRGLAG